MTKRLNFQVYSRRAFSVAVPRIWNSLSMLLQLSHCHCSSGHSKHYLLSCLRSLTLLEQ